MNKLTTNKTDKLLGQDRTVADEMAEIHEAAKGGDHHKLEALLKDHPYLAFSKDENCMTPLHHAAENGHEKIAMVLLANTRQADPTDNIGMTPLHRAALNGHEDAAKLLLAPWRHCSSPSRFRLLLTRKAEVNAKDKNEWTPLHEAALNGHDKIVALLLAHKPDVNSENNVGATPLHYARANRHDRVEVLLVANGGRSGSFETNRKPVAYAMRAAEVADHDILQAIVHSNNISERKDSVRQRPKECVAPSLKCQGCGTRYYLIDDALLMSPTQVHAEFERQTGAFVLSDNQSEFVVSRTATIPAAVRRLPNANTVPADQYVRDTLVLKKRRDDNHITIMALIEATSNMNSSKRITWWCRKCDKHANEFPPEWNEQWSTSFSSVAERDFVFEEFKRFSNIEGPWQSALRSYLTKLHAAP